MRTFFLSFLLLAGSAEAYCGTYGEALIRYYDFKITEYDGGYVWAWSRPEVGVPFFHLWCGGAKTDRETLERYPVLVTYRISNNEPIFWVHFGAYQKYCGFAEDGLFANRSAFGTAGPDNASPLDPVFMAANGLRSSHPDEYKAPERPDPEGGGEGEGGMGAGYDYRGRLDTVILHLSVISSTAGLLLGLFLWRLVMLSKSQREL